MPFREEQISLHDRAFADQFFLDNELFFNETHPNGLIDMLNEPSAVARSDFAGDEPHGGSSLSDAKNSPAASNVSDSSFGNSQKNRFSSSGFNEFVPSRGVAKKETASNPESSNEGEAVNSTLPSQEKEASSAHVSEEAKESSGEIEETPSILWFDHGTIASNHSSQRLRRRDDNFEIFMDSNGIPDYMADGMSPGLSFNQQWRDDGW